jgi:hypothetical protein
MDGGLLLQGRSLMDRWVYCSILSVTAIWDSFYIKWFLSSCNDLT